MKKRILSLILLLLICISSVSPLCAFAAEDLSLTLHYQKNETAFSDLPIGIYLVAKALPNGTYQLVEPFASYPINIYGITTQEQWQDIAQTVYSYIVAGQIQPTDEKTTAENGSVSFTGLEAGLYFVREVSTETNDGIYVFNQLMVYVPTPKPDGTYLYQVEAKPKCTGFTPKTQYSVTKLWQDSGYQNNRPKEILVNIYKDGVLFETQTLHAENNWTYNWYVSQEDHSKWTVAEKASSSVYQVKIQQNGSYFSIINTYRTTPDVPKTGDSFTPMLWVILLCFSGVMLVILGYYSRRKG
ncbi:MAG: Cna B-type domain-containing protein [Clostridiales bacterium]|nr:Cna B-type domain-containing protein [Clostridiales bacterium]